MRAISIMAIVLTIFALNVRALDLVNVTCVTDEIEYYQGENVVIKITNDSGRDIDIVDRKYIDGGFAAIEIKQPNGGWKPIDLITAANVVTFKPLKTGEAHAYVWNTKGYNRWDTLAIPGLYRVAFGSGMTSNEFIIKKNTEP